MSIIDWLERFAWRTIAKREPDLVIRRGQDKPYLRRWHVVRSRWFCIYVHYFASGDPDDVLHDHPWDNLTICLRGRYQEIMQAHGQVERIRTVRRGRLAFRRATTGHRIELLSSHALTLFIAGPRYREWGFWCPKGWVPWTDYVSASNRGSIGRGCA